MKQRIRSGFFLLLSVVLLIQHCTAIGYARETTTPAPLQSTEDAMSFPCKSVILMEATTGTVLFEQNADQALPPASVTKIMTLLLIMEAVDAGTVHLDDRVFISATAASMGGSQVYLKEGEQMSLEDLLKCVVIASANDAAVALAEYISGSVSAFVSKMNAKAKQLGMENTCFENVTGLDDTAENHLTSARDIALMSRALIAHPTILQYSSIWMDTIRNGEFGLTNTNRLVRFYQGCTGLKTGSTSKAGFCVSVTAQRENLSLICVVMGAASRDERNGIATQLLDWGFANYGLYRSEAIELTPQKILGGNQEFCKLLQKDFSCVLTKEELSAVQIQTAILPEIAAPTKEGSVLGEAVFLIGDREIGRAEIVAAETVERITFFEILQKIASVFFLS
ncbi:MAG: D-alanyl-D-alanine carboxypeptidase [Clostridia bacterium]|nr:D-alanyl-D-alanine carboxypeptidase [Clostridia bacterium]